MKKENWENLIIALMSRATIAQAGQQIGVSETTIYRMLRDPNFQKEYLLARRLAFGQSIARLQQIASKAVTVLEGLLDKPDCPEHVLVTAARTVLELGRQSIQDDEILERIERLEDLFKKQSEDLNENQ